VAPELGKAAAELRRGRDLAGKFQRGAGRRSSGGAVNGGRSSSGGRRRDLVHLDWGREEELRRGWRAEARRRRARSRSAGEMLGDREEKERERGG
jgi:hypothetical protein